MADDLLDFIPDDDELETEEEIPSKTYAIDFDNGRIVGNIDDIEAVRQAILKAIITPRFKCMIYDDDYGSEIQEDILNKGADSNYLMTVIPDYVKEALSIDERVLDVGDFDIQVYDGYATVEFTAHTVFGDIQISEEV